MRILCPPLTATSNARLADPMARRSAFAKAAAFHIAEAFLVATGMFEQVLQKDSTPYTAPEYTFASNDYPLISDRPA